MPHDAQLAADLAATIRDVPNFPKPGILFKDIMPVLQDPVLFRRTCDGLAAPWRSDQITHVLAIESRGFLFGAPVALALGAALVPVRKPGKLPYHIVREHYALEYGTDALEVHRDAFHDNARVLIVDDLLATGGTAVAAIRLSEGLDATVAGVAVVVALEFLPWRQALVGRRVEALVSF
ncbi:MAG: adenine phosphoribosyltransferase [Gemmatimonadota bacterium]|nr:adenine phosphoribosyltransferase [Gemmatimonadota bacterium]